MTTEACYKTLPTPCYKAPRKTRMGARTKTTMNPSTFAPHKTAQGTAQDSHETSWALIIFLEGSVTRPPHKTSSQDPRHKTSSQDPPHKTTLGTTKDFSVRYSRCVSHKIGRYHFYIKCCVAPTLKFGYLFLFT